MSTQALVHRSRAGPSVPIEVQLDEGAARSEWGGYEIVHASPGLELGVYVLFAPEPDRQQPHEDDEVYFVLDGHGVLEVEGKPVPLETGQAVFGAGGCASPLHGLRAAERACDVRMLVADRLRPWPVHSCPRDRRATGEGWGRVDDDDDDSPGRAGRGSDHPPATRSRVLPSGKPHAAG